VDDEQRVKQREEDWHVSCPYPLSRSTTRSRP
jgi:hypothetical protein